MRGVWFITLVGIVAEVGVAGAGTNELLQAPAPPAGASVRSQAVAPPRAEWRDPRSLLDESRPPTASSGSTPQALKSWQQRDLPQLDQRVYEMELRNQPDFNQKLLEELDWYFARQKQQEMLKEPLPKPPLPPRGEPKIGDVTPFELEPSTQPTTRPGGQE